LLQTKFISSESFIVRKYTHKFSLIQCHSFGHSHKSKREDGVTIVLGLVIAYSWVQAEDAITIVHLTICITTWEWNPEYGNVLS